ncbi:MAG TPA: hypothetical protein VFG01_02355 [Acidobacteriota bacterium]|nr:hypothetical protein [Acidobacteriota bacterium]
MKFNKWDGSYFNLHTTPFQRKELAFSLLEGREGGVRPSDIVYNQPLKFI